MRGITPLSDEVSHILDKTPKRNPKLKGQRLGQVVYNAIANEHIFREAFDRDEYVGGKLFYISDEDLVKLINDYLKEQ